MYYTQIILNPTSRKTMEIMKDVYKQHILIMSGFKDYDAEELGRVLYRIEMTDSGKLTAIVQSFVLPTYRVELAHDYFKSTKTKEVLFSGKPEPLFSKGMSFRFRLRANTVVTRNGKRIGLIYETALREWFEKRTPAMGISLRGYDVIDEGYIQGKRNGKDIRFKIARYEGLLKVEEKDIFSRAYINGFGHARGFGCGLISLARI